MDFDSTSLSFRSAIPLDHSKDPCKKDFVPDTEASY